ncbi:MAG: tRNA preQ1(34) S-adenosylmethionine ribosyltransferase-isomerase QueA [Opitutales bacterium]|nr:tRNA preQ1(34) S-adenosylmethionine ribosyltransferase-isomerase QueA [Opitutales bacterium]
MDASILDYNLPKERIAQLPAQKRDNSKLLVFRRETEEIEHRRFSELGEILPRQFSFIRNNAAVLKARIFANRKSGGFVECLLLAPVENNIWRAMLRPGKKLPAGSRFFKDGIFEAEVLEKFEDGQAIVEFVENKFSNVVELCENIGAVPLPPYIERDQKSPDYDRKFDNERYETVYADPSRRVAAAAPTAGLHFTPELCSRLEKSGNTFNEITLHVGLGTFQPIKSEKIEDHKMHSEIYEIPPETLRLLKSRKDFKTLMVGTTSLRASEDFCRKNPPADCGCPYFGDASLFVYPPQEIISADALITNFHLPRSTLMCLVGAFLTPGKLGGIEKLKEIYKTAIENDYRFFSYGDAMLIL